MYSFILFKGCLKPMIFYLVQTELLGKLRRHACDVTAMEMVLVFLFDDFLLFFVFIKRI